MKAMRHIVLMLLMCLSGIVGMAQEYERREIKILDFKEVSNFHIDYAKEFAYQESNRDSTIWALLIVETNDPNIRVISSESNPGHYLWTELRAKPRFDINEHRMPNEIWYSMREGAQKFRVVHSLYRHDSDIPQLMNSKGKHIGRIKDNWYIPVAKMLGEYGLVEAGKTYRLVIDVPQTYPGPGTNPEPEVVTPGFVTFTTEPVGGTVTITQGGEVVATQQADPDWTTSLPYGFYEYTVSKPNYHTATGRIQVSATAVTENVALRPAFGSLTINSTPSGATVMIDGMAQSGVTPLTIPQLPSGSHTITLSKADYSQATRTVTITDGQQTVENIALDARFAMVTINSLPGASIYVDNRLVGTGNYSGNLNSAYYTLKASLKSHRDATATIQVVAKVPQTVELKPTPIYGTMTVMSSPTGSDIIIDGVNRGVTPMNITDLLVGEYDVVISKSGYASHTQRVTIDEKTPATINARLQSGRSVTITTGTAGDAIYVDGSYIGTTPVTAELAFGSHTLRATRNDKGKQIETSETVTVVQGTTPLTFTLRLKSGTLTPRWSSSATAEQRRIIGELIESMVMVEGGTFTMGATSEQGSDAESDEKPTHRVTLSDYYIGAYEVTQEQWQAVMGSNPSYYKGNRKPVENVSWNDCREFIKKLNSLTGLNFVLPTEAQWEYAARGGNKSRGYKYSGSNSIGSVAWYYGNSSDGTKEVGQKQPNELGLYDMSGNVYEWCQDWYGSSYYASSPSTNPTVPSTGSYRVDRGGCWIGSARYCRVSDRHYFAPDRSFDYLGLRLAINIDENSDVNHEEVVSIPGGLMPRWSSSATAEQRRIIGELIESMVMVEGGTFIMGATSEQGSDAYYWEKPTHRVTLSDYYIGKYEVTQEQWQAVMGSNPSYYKGSRKPVEEVSWNKCQEFIKKLNSLTGLNFSLPTEAQWEYAARGGNKSRGYKYSGSNDIESVAWYYDNSSDGTKEVGQKQPNELGLYDMSGNVWEWCQDWIGDYSSSSQTDPAGPSTGSYRVNRGGSWNNNARNCRVSNRNNNTPGASGYYYLGLRLVASQF